MACSEQKTERGNNDDYGGPFLSLNSQAVEIYHAF